MTRAVALLLAFLMACSDPRPQLPVQLVATPSGGNTRLTLVPAAGIRLNARIPPALELSGGTVVRFHGSRLSADSAYFVSPPEALLPGRRGQIHGHLRASVCDSGAAVCRTIEVDI
jgi:hypothetical protein